MSEIKPVAWMYEKDIDGIDVTVKVFRQYRQDLYPWKETSLYAVPDTHRIVSVELLESMRAEFCRAAEDVSDWGDYASTYFQNKHDLKSCIAHYSLQAKKVQAIIDKVQS
jgi:hypothetical protein